MNVEFITLEDVTDEIVSCTEADVAEANEYLLNVAKRFNVNEARIVLPPVYSVKRLGVVYALYICCVRNIGKDNIVSLNTESTRVDIYAQKAKFFKAELDLLEKTLSSADFINKSGGYGSGFSVPVRRG